MSARVASKAKTERLRSLEKELKELEKLGLVKEEHGKWTLTEKGEFYV
tara:strand:- start:2014 stop:2157 length:144 start_codon:yes stop_codon:yes gene_type:complete